MQNPTSILSGKGEKEMNGKKVLGLTAICFMLLLVMATPGPAAEKTIQLNIPGCHV
jgi:hypothetical protein